MDYDLSACSGLSFAWESLIMWSQELSRWLGTATVLKYVKPQQKAMGKGNWGYISMWISKLAAEEMLAISKYIL